MPSRQVDAHKPHQRWSKDKKAEAAIAVLAYGSIKKASAQIHVPEDTLGYWTREDEYVIDLLQSLQAEKALEHQHTYGLIVDQAQQVVLDKMDELTPAQANLVACQATDKGLLLAGKPTSISGKSETMESLAGEFIKLAKAIKAQDKVLVPKSTIINGSQDKDG